MMTPNNQDNSGIVFDAKSGISEEEQREILAKIDNIAEKNRLSLSEGEGKNKKTRFKAKKSGGRFPVIVNIIAFAALAGGLFILISMQGKTDARIRTGTRVYNSAERALIEEIRKETQNEAAGELERLNREQSQAAAIEDQMGAFFANLNRQITDKRLDEAGATIRAMREFINTPAFGAIRSIQSRKGLYTQAINSFEAMLDETRKYQTNSGAGGNIDTSGLQARITQLEQNLAEKDKTIAAFSSQGTSATRRLTELENTNKTLQTDLDRQNRSAATLQQNLTQTTAQYQQAASDLQTERGRTATLTQTVSSRDATIQQRDNSIRDLQQRINRIQEVVQGKAAVNMTIAELSDSVNRIQEMLGINQ